MNKEADLYATRSDRRKALEIQALEVAVVLTQEIMREGEVLPIQNENSNLRQ